MKTYTRAARYPVGTVGHSKNSMMINIIEPDPKREGLYIWSQYQTQKGAKARRFCWMYGKCNQAAILKETKNMIEVS
jgi:hypothetical protein